MDKDSKRAHKQNKSVRNTSHQAPKKRKPRPLSEAEAKEAYAELVELASPLPAPVVDEPEPVEPTLLYDPAVNEPWSRKKLDDEQAKEIGSELSRLTEFDTPLAFEYWELLAYDIVRAQVDDETLAKGYGISVKQLELMKNNTYFTKMVDAKRDEVNGLGADADFTIKMRLIAHQATPELRRKLVDPGTAPKDFYMLYKLATELGKLAPSADDKVTGGTAVTFNILGVPGLEHASPTGKVIDVTPKGTSEPTSGAGDDELVEL